jgi:hypothetical protein
MTVDAHAAGWSWVRKTVTRLPQAALLGLLAVAGAVSLEKEATAGAPIDLTGEWTVGVEGGVSLTCTASVVQTGLELEVLLVCPGVADTPLEGDFDPKTRAVSLDLQGELGLDIDLEGTVSADGTSVDGTWRWRGGDLAGTFHATRGLEPQPAADLNGSWTVQTGRTLEDCGATVQQLGASVQLDLQCPGWPGGTLTGQIDGPTLVLSDAGSEVNVTVTADGRAIAGWWTVRKPCCDFDTFTGLKQADHRFDGSATGDWAVTVMSGILGVCDVAVEQSAANEVFAAFDCGLAGGYWLRGPIDPDTATFRLEGIAGADRDYEVIVRGVMSEDGQSFAGTFVARHERQVSFFPGVMEGQQVDDSPSFMDVSGTRELHLITKFGEEVYCSAHVSQTHEMLEVPTNCVGVGDGTLRGWLSPLTGELSAEGDVGPVHLELSGTATDSQPHVLEGEWTSDRRYVEGCFTTDTSADCEQESFRVSGDANCDGWMNSLDAALVLQVSAGLITYIDLCFDGSNVADLRDHCCQVVINAVDAALILQINAGLLGRLAG